jgi:hypothetical protein
MSRGRCVTARRSLNYPQGNARIRYKVRMDSDWDLILTKLDGLQRDVIRIGEIIVSLSTEMDQTRGALEQVHAELSRTKKQAATLKALSPYRRYARAG